MGKKFEETMISFLILKNPHRHFQWMLRSFSDLQRTHPVEDEILNCLLCLGICKAVAVTGGDQVRIESRQSLQQTTELDVSFSFFPFLPCYT